MLREIYNIIYIQAISQQTQTRSFITDNTILGGVVLLLSSSLYETKGTSSRVNNYLGAQPTILISKIFSLNILPQTIRPQMVYFICHFV
jgi:hypothetical protein